MWFLVNYFKLLWTAAIVKTTIQYYFLRFDQDFLLVFAKVFYYVPFMSNISWLFGLSLPNGYTECQRAVWTSKNNQAGEYTT